MHEKRRLYMFNGPQPSGSSSSAIEGVLVLPTIFHNDEASSKELKGQIRLRKYTGKKGTAGQNGTRNQCVCAILSTDFMCLHQTHRGHGEAVRGRLFNAWGNFPDPHSFRSSDS